MTLCWLMIRCDAEARKLTSSPRACVQGCVGSVDEPALGLLRIKYGNVQSRGLNALLT